MESLKSWKTWKFLIIAALVDWVLVHLLDVVKTGTATLAGKLLSIVTLGSHTVRDAPYSAASLNPYPIPGVLLILVLALGVVPWWAQRAWTSLPFEVKRPYYRAFYFLTLKKININGLDPEKKTFVDAASRLFPMLFLLIGLELFTIGSIMTLQAIEIRQSFDTNLDIVAPYITSQQILESRSEFAQIRTQQQFRDLMKRFTVVANSHHLKLRDPNV